MAKCMCGLLWQIGETPIDEHEARCVAYAPCPICADTGEDRFIFFAPLDPTNVVPFPARKGRLQ